MKFLKTLLVAVGLLCASVAEPTTWYAAHNGNDNNNGLTSGTPKTITSYLNGTATAGDIVYLADGTYPASQANSGGHFWTTRGGIPGVGNRITFIGNIAAPGNVRLDAPLTLSHFYCCGGTVFANQYITVKGVSVNGAITIRGRAGSPFESPGGQSDSIVYCIADSGFSAAEFNDCVIANNRFGSIGAEITFSLGENTQNNNHSFRNKIKNNTIVVSKSTPGTGGGNIVSWTRLDSCQILSNRFQGMYFGSANNTVHGNTWFGCQNNLVLDNYWIYKNLIDNPTEIYSLNIRDSTRFNLWARDTIDMDSTSTNKMKVEFATSGAYASSGYNTYTNCIFRTTGTNFGYQNTGDGDVHKFNTYISRAPFHMASGNVIMDSLTFRHNTFISFDNPVLTTRADFDSTRAYLTNNNFKSNLFVAMGSELGTHMEWKWGITAGTRDSNMYYAVPNDSAARFDYAYLPQDSHSRWGTPLFANNGFWTFDATPGAYSIAGGADLWADGYVGAINPPDPGVDPLITSATMPNGRVGVAYSQHLEAIGGVPPYTWVLASGTLPPNTAIDEFTSELNGIPSVAGTYNFSVTCTDDLAHFSSGPIVWTVLETGYSPPSRRPRWWWWW